MKKSLVVLLILFVGLIFMSFVMNLRSGQDEKKSAKDNFVPNEVLVKFKEGIEESPARMMLESIGGKVVS